MIPLKRNPLHSAKERARRREAGRGGSEGGRRERGGGAREGEWERGRCPRVRLGDRAC